MKMSNYERKLFKLIKFCLFHLLSISSSKQIDRMFKLRVLEFNTSHTAQNRPHHTTFTPIQFNWRLAKESTLKLKIINF